MPSMSTSQHPSCEAHKDLSRWLVRQDGRSSILIISSRTITTSTVIFIGSTIVTTITISILGSMPSDLRLGFQGV